MTSNLSLALSTSFKDLLQTDLTRVFGVDFPVDLVNSHTHTNCSKKPRDRVYTQSDTLFTMLLTSVQEDKSLQSSVNIFKQVFEERCLQLREKEKALSEEERQADKKQPPRAGQPKKYKSKTGKSKKTPLSSNTAAYAKARIKLDKDLVEKVFDYSTGCGDLKEELWHGMKVFITDGTYIQLQDTQEIREKYFVKEADNSYPQALLQVLIGRGTGFVSQFRLTTRHQSELEVVIPMLKKMERGSLLLADDLYNTYYHFGLISKLNLHMIVPGKRERNYRVIRKISDNDEIVEIKRTSRPDYVTRKDWDDIPHTLELRRITYNYPACGGTRECVLYTTLKDENITAIEIILMYEKRWDVEISIRETKVLMGINVLKSKTQDMMLKELTVALTAYNMVRKIIARSAEKADFPPQKDIFQKCTSISSPIFLDKKQGVCPGGSAARDGKTT